MSYTCKLRNYYPVLRKKTLKGQGHKCCPTCQLSENIQLGQNVAKWGKIKSVVMHSLLWCNNFCINVGMSAIKLQGHMFSRRHITKSRYVVGKVLQLLSIQMESFISLIKIKAISWNRTLGDQDICRHFLHEIQPHQKTLFNRETLSQRKFIYRT